VSGVLLLALLCLLLLGDPVLENSCDEHCPKTNVPRITATRGSPSEVRVGAYSACGYRWADSLRKILT